MHKNKNYSNLLRLLSLSLLVIFSLTILSGCLKKEKSVKTSAAKPIELVYYKLFDDEDVIRPLIQQYQGLHPNVVIKYKKFTNPNEYYQLILNELAEGEGPDLFSVPNYWLKPNSKKIYPMPVDAYGPKDFEDTFVNVAYNDAVFTDPKDGVKKVFGLPMQVDTLALYYNKDLYEDRVPARGRPGSTWDEFKDDVFKLTKADNSFERFEVAGTAMGRFDNVARSLDILYMLMLQYKIQFYNDKLNQAQFTKQNAISSSGAGYNPANEALKLYTSFGLASQKNYSWNEYIADSNSDVKEMEAFARGKVATIFGYSYLYDQIKAEIEDLKRQNVQTINADVIRISPVPQVNNPDTSTEKRDAYANYFVETVGRNTENHEAAWDFLLFVTSKDNLAYYNQKTHRPTSRRDLIEDQKKDAIYGVYAEQVGYAESLDIYDWNAYAQIFGKAITDVINVTASVKDALTKAEGQLNEILPEAGLLAAPAVIPTTTKTTQKSTGTADTTTAKDATTKSTNTSAKTN